ncbi:MAG: protein kinase [Pirellulaceae bacterium]
MNESTFEGSDSDQITKDSSVNEGIVGNSSSVASISKIGRFQIVERLGKGGFGTVYLANDPDLIRRVAIKVPRWDRPLDEASKERFLLEGQLLAKASHPSIVGVYDVGVSEEGIPYVVMQFIEGITLSKAITSSPLAQHEVLKLLLQIAEALQHAHKVGLVHRDFKPGNVILGIDQRIHLVDFGLALHDDLVFDDGEEGHIAGTPTFMAPEQIRGENHLINGQTDIWAFGVTMYLLLVGQMPFRGADRKELIKAICYKNPRPLRQLDESIPRELERICLHCLEKLIDDRYRSMADVIEELTNYSLELSRDDKAKSGSANVALKKLETETSAQPTNQSDAPILNTKAPLTTSGGNSTHKVDLTEIAIVPKGLRAFDQNDHEFFLSLLPGPYDRNGIAESIRFWASRVDAMEQVEPIPFGLIYGPSGCGKSSYVRAGLLPILSNHVVPVYVDCTTDDLSARAAECVRREIDDVPDVPLSEIIRRVRHGEFLNHQDKLLLVFDQFEQWLHQANRFDDDPFTLAMRQCDPKRVQALFLIRDDFWMSASQFFRCLEGRIEEGKNAMALPLFDVRHARKVLVALGQAYGALPKTGELSKTQHRFIKEVVSSLSNRDKVVSVHLVVFAETAKAKEWNHSELVAMGGWRGVGREFIAGLFANPEVPKFIRQHATEVWRILRVLIPPVGVDIKGQSRSKSEIQTSSGLTSNSRLFQELLDHLEHETKLITLLDRDDSRDNIEPNYTLTHDFLVEPIRQWGAALQKTSLRGRAEAKLSELADQWRLTREHRFLPGSLEVINLSLFAGSEVKAANAGFWAAAKSKAAKRLSGFAVVFLIGMATLLFALRGQRVAIAKSEFQQYLACNVEGIERQFETVMSYPQLTADFASEETQSDSPDNSARALAALISLQPTEDLIRQFVNLIDQVAADEYKTFCLGLENCDADFLELIESNWTNLSLRAKARTAVICAELGEPQFLIETMALTATPELRATTIVELISWNGDFSLIQHLQEMTPGLENGPLFSGVCSAVGMSADRFPPNTLDPFKSFLESIYRTHPDSGAHYAAMFALSKCGFDVPEVNDSGIAECRWKHVTIKLPAEEHELFFALIPQGKFPAGAGDPDFADNISYNSRDEPPLQNGSVAEDVWMSVFETRSNLYAEFLTDNGQSERLESMIPHEFVHRVSWNDIAEFCIWLNAQLDLPPTWKPIADDERALFVTMPDNNGLRTPTADEFEKAYRGFYDSKYLTGESPELLPYFGYTSGVMGKGKIPFPPNALGLFNLLDGTAEWSYSNYRGVSSLLKGGNDDSSSEDYLLGKADFNLTNQAYENYGFRLSIKKGSKLGF